MRFLAPIFAALAALTACPALANDGSYVVVEEWVVVESGGSERFVSAPPLAAEAAIARFGPFQVVDGQRAQMVGITDSRAPAQFAAMLNAYPELEVLEMVDCPGTFDDRANLRVGRMIRDAGIATHVPAGGSVRSGAVELFVAGASRRIDDGAEFAVHAWLDEDGMEAGDYAANSPENRKYLAYYREMGMSDAEAQAFYSMTNSASFENAKWLDAEEMRFWISSDGDQETASPQLAYLDFTALLN